MSALGTAARQAELAPNWSLADLLSGFAVLPFESGPRVTGLTLDSRDVVPGSLFLACAGRTTHGLGYAEQAAEGGCVAIAAEPDTEWGEAEFCRLAAQLALPVIPVANLGKRAAEIAARFFGHPDRSLELFGVYGSDVKTGVTHYLAEALALDGDRPGLPCGVMSAAGTGLALEPAAGRPGLRTSDPVALHRELALARARGARAVALEVSSPALARRRIGGVRFSHAVLTDLSPDHLDDHDALAPDAAGMRQLLRMPGLRWAVLNADDPASADLAATVGPEVGIAAYGQGSEPPVWAADLWVWARDVRAGSAGLDLAVETSAGRGAFTTGLLGRWQVGSLLAVLAVLLTREEPLESALGRLRAIKAVPGRMERFGGGDRPLVVVDDANTPSALERALTGLRAHCAGRLSVVFGCDGGRDAGERPAMGAVAERLADAVILTEDNPRLEDGERIVAQILAGMGRPAAALVQRQRALAIRAALARAGRGDAVLVAGRGSEIVQDMGELKVQFSDRAQVVQALNEWEGRRT